MNKTRFQTYDEIKYFIILFQVDTEGGYFNFEKWYPMPSICEWKLNFQLQHILMRIWENPQNTIQSVIQSIEDNYVEEIAIKRTIKRNTYGKRIE